MRRHPEWQNSIPVPVNGTTEIIDVKNIEWFEANGNYVIIRIKDQKLLIRSTIRGLMNKLDKTEFTHVHMSLVVMNEYITDISSKGNGKFILEINSHVNLESSKSFKENIIKLKS